MNWGAQDAKSRAHRPEPLVLYRTTRVDINGGSPSLISNPPFSFVTAFRIRIVCLVVAVWIGGGILAGCDQVAPVEGTGQRPLVSDVLVRPDSVNAADLSPDQVEDSLARIPLTIAASIADPDGQIERVVFTIEPSANPRGTASGSLVGQGENVYARQVGLQVPVGLNEVYTVRVFAVDDDSLESNQGVGRFRFVPEQ